MLITVYGVFKLATGRHVVKKIGDRDKKTLNSERLKNEKLYVIN
jgi:hypothetical protein